MNIKERILALPNATLEDLCAASSPKVRFEFTDFVDGVEQCFYSIDGYRIGTIIMVSKVLPDHEELAQKILDESIEELNNRVNNVGFSTSIDIIENGKYAQHTFK